MVSKASNPDGAHTATSRNEEAKIEDEVSQPVCTVSTNEPILNTVILRTVF